ncbi:WEB family protein [Striga hermonthica]|uniref:WEB family protein n=1 Tax=Striga hermonthica TaxID=68872 RepID=A0A9N7NSA9_STRHE|nr:WEB family protein [Striga hermonthica]
MAENYNAESVETKKIMPNPRAEIDFSPPFESVKEAVDRFGGGGAPWIPIHLLRLAAARHDNNEPFDMTKMEEEAMLLERDLFMKEQQTHNVLKELDAAKKLLDSLKLDLIPEFSSSSAPTPDNNSTDPYSAVSPSPMFVELNQAKRTLNRTSTDLATIQASLESLNRKLREDKILLGRTKMQIQTSENNRDLHEKKLLGTAALLPDELKDKEFTSFEAEQFKRMTEASRYEVVKAMAEIERTKDSIKMAEMRLHAAKKMEEAAKAVEAIALAEKTAFSNGKKSLPDVVFPPKKGEKRPEIFEETTKNVVLERTGINNNNNFVKFKFRNSVGAHRSPPDAPVGVRRMGPQDDAMVGRRAEDYPPERGHVSLSQMLQEQSRGILHHRDEPKEDENIFEKRQYFFQMKKKKFGFIQVPVYNRNSKKKR